MSKVLITGASRGIGLELARQFSARGDEVIATCRSNPGGLGELNVRVIDGVDVCTAEGIGQLRQALGGEKLDLLVHVAGILTRESIEDMDFDRIQQQFMVNAIGPLRVVHGLLDNLGPGSRVGLLTSRMGSIADNGSGGMYGYRMSKAALNAGGVSLARDLESRDILVTLLHPGMVATEMTDHKGIPVEEAAKGLIERLDELDLSRNGTFWHAEGYELPW